MLYALWQAGAALNLSLNRNLWLYALICVSLYALRKWSAGALPRIPLEDTRDLRGKVIFVTNPFTSSALPLLPLLLSHGARVILLVSPEEATSPRALQLLAVLQLSDNPGGKPEIYIEAVDLRSEESIKAFSEQWEKASVRKGALNEEIGRVPVGGLIFFPSADDKPDLNLYFVKSLLASFEKTAISLPPDPMLQASASPQQIRIVQVVDSPFYAAAANFPSSTSTLSTWRRKAVTTLNNVILFKEAQNRLIKPDNKIIFLSVSPGLTRSSLFELLTSDASHPIFTKRSAWVFKQFYALLNVIFLVALSPLVWLFGKSHSEGVKGVEWALVAPMKRIRDGQAVKGVQGGSLFRDGNDAGVYLKSMHDEALGEALWRMQEEKGEGKTDMKGT